MRKSQHWIHLVICLSLSSCKPVTKDKSPVFTACEAFGYCIEAMGSQQIKCSSLKGIDKCSRENIKGRCIIEGNPGVVDTELLYYVSEMDGQQIRDNCLSTQQGRFLE